MSYDVYLFRKEVKEQNKGFDFLEKEDSLIQFTEEQFDSLKRRLLSYKFEIENEQENAISFNFQGGKLGISVLLTEAKLAFSSNFSVDGIFEIGMTASEFTDSGEFVKYDPQAGGWEEI